MITFLKNIQFENAWAWYLMIIPVLLLLYNIYKRTHFQSSYTVSSLASLPLGLHSLKIKLYHLIPYLYICSIILLIICIARPKGSAEGISIVIATDISGSMGMDDLKPNRLAAALSVAEEFIQGRPKDRIGLVVFKAEAFTQCPITTDHDALLEQLSKLQLNVLTDGTAIGLGLGTSVARLKESKSKSKVIILLTDGANNAGFLDPELAADMAKTENIRVYTIALGIQNYQVYVYDNVLGQEVLVKSEYDEKLLQMIAKKTNGKFYNASNNKKLEEIFKDIDLLEKNIIQDDQFSKRDELFYPIAFLALGILLLAFVLQNTYLKTIS